MTSDELDRLGASLQVMLPDSYRQVLEEFPLAAYAGNTDTAVWDDADGLIELNRELRRGSKLVKAWPNHFLALGRDAGGCTQAIDLQTGKLWWADRGHLDSPTSYAHPESFEAWAAEYFEGLKSDLEGEGGDASGSPQERAALQEKNAKASVRTSAALLGVILLGIAALALWWFVKG